MRALSLCAAALVLPAILGAQEQQAKPATVIPAPDTKLPREHTPQPTTADITPADLMTRLYIFADDSMQGREAGTIGNFKGTAYIANEVQKLGLVPAGDSGTYFQTVPLKTRRTDSSSTLIVAATPLQFGTEWTATGSSMAKSNLPVVYGGTIGEGTLISPDQAAGKLVVFSMSSSPTARRAIRNPQALASAAAAVAVVAPANILGFISRPSEFVDDPSSAATRTTAIFIAEAAASKLFDQPLSALRPGVAGKTATFDIRITSTPVLYPARNVVALLPGRDPQLKGEYVAIGAHNDHIGFNTHPVDHDSIRIYNHIVRPRGADTQRNQATPEQQAQVNELLAQYRARHPGSQRADSISNGADDDGSGTVSALEVAQKFASLKGDARPRRSILFVWHVGEEKGLLGSTYFTDHPTVPRDSIVAQLNMDMVGRGDAWDDTGTNLQGDDLHGGPNYLMIVGSHRLSTELGDLIETVNRDDHHDMRIDYAFDANGHPENIYCRSDHYEYARYGIPIAFFTTGLHSDYHQVTDEPEYIDYDNMAKVDRLVYDVAMHVADLDHRVVVDHPKPDPHGACRQ
ncbi:MAG TPA: M28 family peptidase [Gemmatimonadaceae bacterium]|nr:M28 family peptidase [Gemmatimonadaceae bacterium]